MQCLKVTFHLWLLQNTGYIPCAVSTSLSLSYTQQFISPVCPLLLPPVLTLVATSLFSVCVSLLLLGLYSLVDWIFKNLPYTRAQ